MIVLILHTVFGFLFGFRIYHKSIQKNVLKNQMLTKISTVYVLFLLLSLIFYSKNTFLYLLCVYLPLFVIIFLENFIVFYKTQQFYNLFTVFLEQVLLKIRSGKSFRSAIEETSVYFCPFFKNKIEEIMYFVVFSPQKHKKIKDSFIKEISNHFILVEKNKHMTLEILENFNHSIKRRQNFRRRSKAITLQIRMQIFLLSIFYTFLSVFVVNKFGFQANVGIFLISSCLFLLGLLMIFWQLKRLQCKI